MIAVAGVVAWVGYWLFAYGLSQVQGQNYGLLDLAWPSRFPTTPPAADSGGGNPDSNPMNGSQTPVPCYCRDTKTLEKMGPCKNGKCPKGQTPYHTLAS